jgi:hypothetical protein
VLLSRFAISRESLSGDDERSGDSGEERGGVNESASSMHLTRFDGLQRRETVTVRVCQVAKGLAELTCNHSMADHSHHRLARTAESASA